MDFSYPISLNLFGKKCSVIGGGQVAERKVVTLLSTGARLQVVSPLVTQRIEEIAANNKITWIKESFSQEFIKDSFLVVAATNNREVNKTISTYCQKNNILVNVIDSTIESNFIVNSFLKRGDLILAISTNGKSPALSRKIKEELKELYGPEYAILLNILGEIRDLAKKTIKDENKRNKFLKDVIEKDILHLIRSGRSEEARERVIQCLLSY